MKKFKEWHQKALDARQQGLNIREISNRLELNYYTVRDFFRALLEDKPLLAGLHENPFLNSQSLLERLQKGKVDLLQLGKNFVLSQELLTTCIKELTTVGHLVNTSEPGYLSIDKKVETNWKAVTFCHWDGTKKIRFGVLSDTHLGSKYQQRSFLNYAYEQFQIEGVSRVFHCGDVTDGVNMRRGHEFEVFQHGADDQVKYVADAYPKTGIETYFITGNHDLSSVQHSGHDIGYAIAHRREDLKYLGPEYARIMLTPECSIDLWHGRDGSAYAHSYAVQKYLEALPGGDKPNILAAGHRHKALWMFERNVHAFEAGCMQAQTPFMRGKKLVARIGFYIVEVTVSQDGSVQEIGHKFFPLYKSVDNDF